MASGRLGSLDVVAVAIAGVAALGVSLSITPALPTGVKMLPPEVELLTTEGFIIGGSGVPIPSQELIDEVVARYNPPEPLFPGQPLFPVSAYHPLFTPEGFYPELGVKELPFDTSVAQGVSILNNTIMAQIAAGNNVGIGGGSQSATIASLEMRDLLALPTAEQPTADQLAFALIVDPSSPNGGVLERFDLPQVPNPSIPSLGITFSGATPADTPWLTAIYDREYDGFSDFPRYPINLLSDLNAELGVAFVHSQTADAPLSLVASAIERPVSAGYTGDTHYFMIPTENLPLLDPLRDYVPVVGNPIADLLQPDLTVLVNLGYGSITDGYDPGPANVPTPMGLFPTNINWADVLTALANGAQQGVKDFINDLRSLSTQSISDEFTGGDGADSLSSTNLSEMIQHALVTGGAGGGADSLPSLTDIVNAFSSAASSGYAALLPIADTVNALVTTMPAYDATLFAQELTSGNLLDAVGLPIAADVGLTSFAFTFGIFVPIYQAATSIIADFQDLIPS